MSRRSAVSVGAVLLAGAASLVPAQTSAQQAAPASLAPAQTSAQQAAPASPAPAQPSARQAPPLAATPRSVEPSVKQLIRMVLRAARQNDPARTRELARRARLAGLMPSLRLGARRGLEQDLSASSTSESERTNTSLGDDLSLEATLSFDLPRLVFAPDEVRLLSVDRWLAQDRRKLVEDAVRLYFQRRRLLVERAHAAAVDPELDLAIAELESLLDTLTDGAFGEALRPR